MTQHGTVRGGVIVPDDPASLIDGTRVAFEPTPDEADEDWEGPPPPPTDETREEFLAGLREDIAAIKAGARGIPIDEAFAQIRADLGLPPDEEL